MRIIAWNVNGVRAVAKKNIAGEPVLSGEENAIRALVTKYKPDVLFLQEIKTSSAEDLTCYGDLFQSVSVFSAEKKGYSGVAMLCKEQPIAVHPGFYHPEMIDAREASYNREGRLITAELPTAVVVGVYVPNSKAGLVRLEERGKWEEHIKEHLRLTTMRCGGKPVVLCGDLNVAHTEVDISNPKSNRANAGFTPQERGWFGDLLASGFIDSWRVLNPAAIKYSWWSPITKARARNAGWRIDYCLLSAAYQDRLMAAEILNDVFGSDHCPVLIDLS
jgi:exodeoxyribonuclease III